MHLNCLGNYKDDKLYKFWGNCLVYNLPAFILWYPEYCKELFLSLKPKLNTEYCSGAAQIKPLKINRSSFLHFKQERISCFC